MRNISNSEVQAWLSCRLMYYYAYVLTLKPKGVQYALDRGTIGHAAMEFYINRRLEGATHEEAMSAMPEYWQSLTCGIDLKMEVMFLFNRYMEFHKGWPEWKLLGTEQRHDMILTDDITIPITYDLMVEEIATGNILIGDFKFTYDFWKPVAHALNGQMYKYITVMQKNGINVVGGFVEEIRTRSLGAEKSSDYRNLWRRQFYYPSAVRRRNALKQHLQASFEIIKFWTKTKEEMYDDAIPVMNQYGPCKYCSFSGLCISRLDGKDVTYDIEVDFEQNTTYGYNFDDEKGTLI